jgi:alpha-amylase/alpha-mannosidase (GH57 family)
MLHFILCWHFHQPDYRDERGEYVLPWVYLHALKDYADMAAHLEATPSMRAVVNFVPTLVEQLDDYAEQFRSGQVRDPLLARLIDPHLEDLPVEARQALLQACFRVNEPTMLDPFPPYRRLYTLWKTVQESRGACCEYLSGQYFSDLLTWYHLAWAGESLRREQPLVLRLLEQGNHYTLADRRDLFHLIGQVISGLIPRYRALAERGQIELSATPHSHPMAPLLVDLGAARQAQPSLDLPRSPVFPGGDNRVMAHIHAAQASHQAHFDRPPAGFWPAEGGVSEPVLRLFEQAGVAWVASGEGVLRHSLTAKGYDPGPRADWLSQPYRLDGQTVTCFFRDDHLSDLIGFEYKNWHSGDAVRHFLHALEEGYRDASGADPVVTVVLDGENAWEFYPYNGWYFLSEFYAALVARPDIRVTTCGEYLCTHPDAAGMLTKLVAGSWVYGDFSTWIGDPAKNRAWDLLCAAKTVYDRVLASGRLDASATRAAEAQLKSCESSDWFWWFGDLNPSDSVQAFDRLYRAKLGTLYQLLGEPLPAELEVPLSRGGGAAEAGGVMRRGQLKA